MLLVKVLIVVVPLALLALWVWRSFAPRTYTVNMLVDIDPNRELVARRLAKEAKRYGLKVELSDKKYGALRAIDEVDKPTPIDLALVPGGVAARDYPDVRQVAALSKEPLQLLARPDLAEKGIAALKGKTICVGPDDASTYHIAIDVLRFAGLDPREKGKSPAGDCTVVTTSPEELSAQIKALDGLTGDKHDKALAEVPDAVFVLSALPSLLAHELVHSAGYRLVELPFADAYCLDRIRQATNGEVRVDRAIFSAMDIPAYTYSVDPPIPAKPCHTIATRLLLVAYAPTDQEAVARLSETVFDGAIAGLVEPVPLKGHTPQFPLHAGTERYMRRSEPLLSPEMASALGKAAGGLGALVSGLIALYSFLRLRQLRRFEAYYKEIRRLELIARGQEQDPNAPADPVARRTYLEDRLLDLKARALADFSNGGMKGEGLMFGIVSLVNDTRASLARLSGATDGRTPSPPAVPASAAIRV
jgi:TRAP-type uncharacterized transport system substrate-binding protein